MSANFYKICKKKFGRGAVFCQIGCIWKAMRITYEENTVKYSSGKVLCSACIEEEDVPLILIV